MALPEAELEGLGDQSYHHPSLDPIQGRESPPAIPALLPLGVSATLDVEPGLDALLAAETATDDAADGTADAAAEETAETAAEDAAPDDCGMSGRHYQVLTITGAVEAETALIWEETTALAEVIALVTEAAPALVAEAVLVDGLTLHFEPSAPRRTRRVRSLAERARRACWF